MAKCPNVINLMGNHEAMALDALSQLLKAMGEDGELKFTGAAKAVKLWFYNGFLRKTRPIPAFHHFLNRAWSL